MMMSGIEVLVFLVVDYRKRNVLEDEVTAERISRKPDELAQQCDRAYQGIVTVPNWLASAPNSMTFLTHSQNLNTQLAAINTLDGQLRTTRQAIKTLIETAREDMTKVDQATDLIYGPDGAQKLNFGLTPKKAADDDKATGTIEQVIIHATKDGTHPASIWVDWDSVEGAIYEIQWFSDAALTQMVGSATVTASEMEVQGLERGNQYWFRVRAVRASETGPWSDQATRVANI